NQDLPSSPGTDADGVLGGKEIDDFPLDGRNDNPLRRIDRKAVPHHFLGKHLVRHFGDRKQPAGHRANKGLLLPLTGRRRSGGTFRFLFGGAFSDETSQFFNRLSEHRLTLPFPSSRF